MRVRPGAPVSYDANPALSGPRSRISRSITAVSRPSSWRWVSVLQNRPTIPHMSLLPVNP